jgi:hypothetical protein
MKRMNKIVGNPRRALDDFRRIFKDSELKALVFFAAIIVAGGTVFYTLAEGWSIVESFYFCVTVLTTVGFGDLHPTHTVSRLFTAGYMILGIGFVLGFISVAARQTITRVSHPHHPYHHRSSKKK